MHHMSFHPVSLKFTSLSKSIR